MDFNKHSNLEGMHAFLSPSKSSWVNYEDEQIVDMFHARTAAARGTRLHKLAHDLIRERMRMIANKTTFNMYVNDALGFKMVPEQTLFYSSNAFGTADAIAFRQNLLRIHDLKTGEKETTMRQLWVYVALFCLEYGYRPFDIDIELRIYQNDAVRVEHPDPGDIAHVMDRIVTFDKRINALRLEMS